MSTPLNDETEAKLLEIIQRLLSSGNIDINKIDLEGNTWLHVAVINSHAEIVKFLVEAGASISIRNNKGQRPSELAVNCKKPERFKIMTEFFRIEQNQDHTMADCLGPVAIHAVVLSGDVDQTRLMISRGVDVNARDNKGNTPLHFATDHVYSENPTIIKILLEAKTEVNAKKITGETPLHWIMKNHLSYHFLTKAMKLFIKFGADFHVVAKNEATPIDYAFYFRNTQAVKALLSLGIINVHEKSVLIITRSSNVETTLLHQAFCYNHIPTIKLLLKSGADINALDEFDNSPLKFFMLYSKCSNSISDDEKAKKLKVLKFVLKRNPNLDKIIERNGDLHLTPQKDHFMKYAMQTVLEHIAKRRMVDNHMYSDQHKIILKTTSFKKYLTKCNQELQMAKNSKIHSKSGNTTFFDLLFDDKQKLMHYTENEDFRKSFDESNVIKKFPIYGSLMDERFSKASKKRLIRDQVIEKLCCILRNTSVTIKDIVENVVNAWNLKDLGDFYSKVNACCFIILSKNF